jgi:hypothetical protein
LALLLSSLFYEELVSITKQVCAERRVECYLADATTEGRLVLVTCGRSIVHLILPLDARRCKFRLFDGLLTLGAHHDRGGCSYVSETVSTDRGRVGRK